MAWLVTRELPLVVPKEVLKTAVMNFCFAVNNSILAGVVGLHLGSEMSSTPCDLVKCVVCT